MVLFRNVRGRKVLARMVLDVDPLNPCGMALVDTGAGIMGIYKTQIIR